MSESASEWTFIPSHDNWNGVAVPECWTNEEGDTVYSGPNVNPSSFMYPLFEHMQREHGLTLLESELSDIVQIAAPFTERAKALQAVRNWYDRDGSVGGLSTIMDALVDPLTISEL